MNESSVNREIKTAESMIRIYCRSMHKGKTLCKECGDLLHYASLKVNRCRFGDAKPACNACPVHCYKPEMREKIREVMRFSGPKMLWKHPVMAFCHLIRQVSYR